MKYYHYLNILLLFALASCHDEVSDVTSDMKQELTFETEVTPFDGEILTRADDDSRLQGTGFENGDWIRLKIICPFVSGTEYGETTYSNSYDGFYLLKRANGSWTPLTSDDKCDISGTYSYSGSPNPSSYYQAQQTPYVFMASTWSEEKSFRSLAGEVIQYCHVFHADQTKEKNFKVSDLLWAQQYMQTGSWNVKLTFKHVMACIEFTIVDSELPDGTTSDAEGQLIPSKKITDNAILSLEGMPDIDQQEVVVGDYYALKSKVNSRFGYREKNSCDYGLNGTVIGIGVNVFDAKSTLDSNKGRAFAYPMSGNNLHACTNTTYGKEYSTSDVIPNTGIYKALRTATKVYRLIVPPCTLADAPKIWVREGEHRYSIEWDQKTFEAGKLYKVKVNLKETQSVNP